MVYPVITAGQRVTAALLTSMLPLVAQKTVNTDRTNNTMSDDPELVLTLESNAVYDVQFDIIAAALLAADIRSLWTVPSGATGLKAVAGPGSTANDGAADNIALRLGSHGFSTVVNYSGVRNSGVNAFSIREWGTVTTTNAGTLAWNWAQITTDATAARVSSASRLTARRIA